MKSYKDVFKTNLKRLRGQQTQSQIAEAADIPLVSYQRAEAGDIPQEKNLNGIAKALGADPTHLFVDMTEFQPRAGITPLEALEIIREAIQEKVAKPDGQNENPAALVRIPHIEKFPDLPDLVAGMNEPDVRLWRDSLARKKAAFEVTKTQRKTPKR